MQPSSAFASRHHPADRVGASVSTGCQTHPDGMSSAASRMSATCRDWSATCSQGLLAVQALAAGEEPDLRRAAVGVDVRCPVLRRSGRLAVDVLVAVVQRSRRRPGAIGTRLAELPGDVHGAGDVLAHHGGLDRGPGVAADRERRRGCASAPRGERCRASVSTMPRPIESSPISANGPTGISPPNSSAIIGQHARDRLAAGGPGGGVGGVGVHHPADLGHVPVDVGVRGGVAGRRQVALDDRRRPGRTRPSISGGQLVVGHSGRLDHHQVRARAPGRRRCRRSRPRGRSGSARRAARRPRRAASSIADRDLRGQRSLSLAPAPGAVSAALRIRRSRCMTSLPPRPK